MPLTVDDNTVRVAFSDDDGASWQLSPAVDGDGLRYGSVVELEDGRLMMVTGHNDGSPRSRMVSYSSDGGETWSQADAIDAAIGAGRGGHHSPGLLVKDFGKKIYKK